MAAWMQRVQARQPSVASAHRGILVYYCYSIQVAVHLSPPPYQPRGEEGEQIVSSKLSSKDNRCSGVEFEFDSSEDVHSTLIWWRRTPQPPQLTRTAKQRSRWLLAPMMLPMSPATRATGATANVKRLLTVASTNVPIWDEVMNK
uniref:Uncharacterized protein n=1 Tax=Oryza nivara TaxID=4536 RepID=A0A0E0HZT2_ORYNI